MKPEAAQTAKFLDKFDQIFDTFNTSTLFHGNPRSRALQMSNEAETIKFLDESHAWLKTVKCKSGSELPCVMGWRSNIVALKLLWEDQKAVGETTLFTRRLNQDLLEHFFGVIR